MSYQWIRKVPEGGSTYHAKVDFSGGKPVQVPEVITDDLLIATVSGDGGSSDTVEWHTFTNFGQNPIPTLDEVRVLVDKYAAAGLGDVLVEM